MFLECCKSVMSQLHSAIFVYHIGKKEPSVHIGIYFPSEQSRIWRMLISNGMQTLNVVKKEIME